MPNESIIISILNVHEKVNHKGVNAKCDEKMFASQG